MSVPHWLPNAISVLRILLVPVWGGVAEWCRHATSEGLTDDAAQARAWTVLVLVTIGVSDVVDGFLARRFGLTTRTGATLDAFADKLAQVSLLLFFTIRGAPAFPSTPLWFLLLMLGRDAVQGLGWLLLKRRLGTVKVVHRIHGKFSSLLFFVLLVALSAGAPAVWTRPLVWAIAGIIVLSTVAYVRDGGAQWRGPTGS